MSRRMRGADHERGSIALEFTILAPALLALLALFVAFDRYGQVTGLLESAARDGARAATQARSAEEANRRVDAVVTDDLGQTPSSCANTGSGTVEDSGAFLPGSLITVTVTCTVDYADLGVPGLPGSHTITRSFVSPLDPYRGVRQ